ncbi:MAG TPA: helix-turn-helix domain-containing protein [Sphingomonadaceae bacterium]|nr:helix-turn-helix domain-containing protein [Sphingomonadaceae bacterium]
MSVIERFATGDIAPRERLAFWNRIASETYAGTHVDSGSEAFAAEMWRWTLGDIVMIRPRSDASVVQRWAKGEAGDEDRVVLHLQHRGVSRHRQGRHEADLRTGDFSLLSASEPYRLDLVRHELLVVELPRAALAARLPNMEDSFARRIAGSSPSGRLLHDFLLSLWQQGDQSNADPDWQQGVANVFYDLVALAVRGAGGPAANSGEALRQRLLKLVDAQLHDPELRTASLAAELGISVRSVQNIFAGMATTPSSYILDRRLERAAELLIADRTRSITATAFELGFNDSAYFTRCFRHRFGATPSSWRSRQ